MMMMLSWIRGFSGMMVRAFLVGVALLLSFALGNPASAVTTYDYVDIDPIFEIVTADNPVSGTFDITTNGGACSGWLCGTGGFVPGTDSAASALVSFLIFDPERGDHDVAIIDLGDPFLQEVPVDENDRFFFVLYLENIEVSDGGVLDQINESGTLNWRVRVAEGNDSLLLAGAALAVEGSVAHAPEPTAALLFCLGFGVVGAATRRRRMH
jgi:hypothetical protein